MDRKKEIYDLLKNNGGRLTKQKKKHPVRFAGQYGQNVVGGRHSRSIAGGMQHRQYYRVQKRAADDRSGHTRVDGG